MTTDRLIDRSISMYIKPEQPLPLDIKIKQKQVVRILTSSSLHYQTKIVGTLQVNAIVFPFRAPLLPLNVVNRSLVTLSCTPTLRGKQTGKCPNNSDW